MDSRCSCNSHGAHGKASMLRSASQASTIPPRALAFIVLIAPAFSPHGKVFDSYPVAGIPVGADDINRASGCARRTSTFPVTKCEASEQDAITSGLSRLPIAINIKRVGIAVADEVFEDARRDGARPSVRFDHEHLVRLPCVDIAVRDFGDTSICTEGSNSTAPTPVAVNILNEKVVAPILLAISKGMPRYQ
jgi:hypothetical protein